ncbi:MAG: phosphoribosyltransferase [Candidatus Hodarchaeota archaeon]
MNYIPYKSRFVAGEILAEFVLNENNQLQKVLIEDKNNFFAFAIPNGGVPVAEGFCSRLDIKYDILIVRKIKIPFNTEAGFGSITTDGTVLINESLLNRLNLSEKEVLNAVELTNSEIKERLRFYNKEQNLEEKYLKNIRSKIIFMMDDGLASGFTMLAAIKMIKKYQPRKIIISVPTAPLHTIKNIEREVDNIYCPNIRNTAWFAVADAYRHWYDVPESEIIEILKNSKYYSTNIE